MGGGGTVKRNSGNFYKARKEAVNILAGVCVMCVSVHLQEAMVLYSQ